MVLVFVLSTGALTGCGDPEEMVENTVQGLIDAENASNEAVAENNSEENPEEVRETDIALGEWPVEIPDYVPQLQGDIIDVVTLNPEEDAVNYTIAWENVTGVTAESYEAELISKGWSIDMNMPIEGEWIIQASRDQDATITVTVSADNSAMMNISIFQ